MLWFIYALLAVLAYCIVRYYRWVRTFPPGPFPLPFIGNAHQIEDGKLFLAFEKFGRKHGPIFTLFVPIPMVVLTDYDTVKEAFVKQGDEFIDRQQDKLADELFAYCDNGGVINSNGENWREQRRNAISILRDFGMGKNLMEEKVKVSIRDYLTHLDELEDKDHVEMRWPIQIMIGNIINGILFGFHYDHKNAAPLLKYINEFQKFMDDLAGFGLLFMALMFPFIRHIPILGYHAVWKHKENMNKIKSFITKSVDKAIESYDPDADPECFVHAYKQRAVVNKFLAHDQLLATCHDFFAAGQETTATTIRWAMLFLADNVPAQEKLREEVLRVVGRDRLPSMADRTQMPYAMATVLEVQRKANILSFGAFHLPTHDAVLKGMKIPAKTIVNGDLHNILANDPIFGDGDHFSPERFLNEDGKTLNKEIVDHCIPFSIGRRQCAGEGLARVELFLTITATLQHYKILPSLDKPINLEPVYNNVLCPRENFVRLLKVE